MDGLIIVLSTFGLTGFTLALVALHKVSKLESEFRKLGVINADYTSDKYRHISR